MKVLVQKIHPDAVLPTHAYADDAGMDLFACEECVVGPAQKALVATGLKIAIPSGYAGFIWDKSGIAAKHHMKTMAGVIDAGYRGELKVVITNLGTEPYAVKKGEKIAQIVIQPVAQPEVEEVAEIGDTERGEGGFGSSGRK
jgi:dUTP pyrophosphatase